MNPCGVGAFCTLKTFLSYTPSNSNSPRLPFESNSSYVSRFMSIVRLFGRMRFIDVTLWKLFSANIGCDSYKFLVTFGLVIVDLNLNKYLASRAMHKVEQKSETI